MVAGEKHIKPSVALPEPHCVAALAVEVGHQQGSLIAGAVNGFGKILKHLQISPVAEVVLHTHYEAVAYRVVQQSVF